MRIIIAVTVTLAVGAGCTTRQARYLNEYLKDSHMDVRPTGNEAVLREMRELRAEQQAMKADLTDLRSLGNAQAADAHGREAAAPQPVVSDDEHVVNFYTQGDSCVPCVKAWNDVSAAMRLGSGVKFVKRAPPQWVLDRGLAFPVLHYKTPRGWVAYQGWSTLKHFMDDYERNTRGFSSSATTDDAPVSVSSAPLPAREPVYSSQWPGNWTWPGDLRYHLQQPPHRMSRVTVYSMSDGECVRAHNSYHEKYGARAAAKNDRMLAKAQLRADKRQERREQGGAFVRAWNGLFGAPQNQSSQNQSYRYQYRSYSRSGRCPTC